MKIARSLAIGMTIGAGLWLILSKPPATADLTLTKRPLPKAIGERQPSALIRSTPSVTETISAGIEPLLTELELKKIKQYEIIKAKVFLSNEEKQMKKTVFADEVLIHKLKNYLLSPIGSDPNNDYQQRLLAIDLMMDASTEGQSAQATSAILSLIEDKKLEDQTISMADRKSLAEMKADLLFIWTARMPQEIERVNALIPGPVTAKIWQNAQAAQEQNRIESISAK